MTKDIRDAARLEKDKMQIEIDIRESDINRIKKILEDKDIFCDLL